MKFKITETCDYEVEAQSDAEAEALFLDFGPSFDERFHQGPISFVGVTEREVIPCPTT